MGCAGDSGVDVGVKEDSVAKTECGAAGKTWTGVEGKEVRMIDCSKNKRKATKARQKTERYARGTDTAMAGCSNLQGRTQSFMDAPEYLPARAGISLRR